ncbi:MAG: FtsX-like permease family protein [Nitriliruptoraceae bacterium]
MGTLRRKLRRDIGLQRGPFAAVVITVLLGVGLFAASYDAYRNLDASYLGVFDRLATADHWLTGGDVDAIAAAVRDTDGVVRAVTRIQVDAAFRVAGARLRGRVVSTGEDLHPPVNDLAVLEGSGGASAVGVEQHMADHFGLEPGERIEVLGQGGSWQDVTIDAVVASGEYLWPARSRQDPLTLPGEFGVLFAPDDVVAGLTGAAPNQVQVRYAEGVDTDRLDQRMTEIAREQGATDAYPLAEQPSNAILQEDITGFSQMAFLFPLLFLTAAGMAAYVLLSRRVHDERAVIGMLRAQGIPRRTIRGHYLGFGVAAGLAGAVPGTLLGLWGARSLSVFYTRFIDLPFTEIAFHPETVVAGVGFGLLVGALAAWAPARQAMRVSPADAMRGVVPATGGHRPLAERALWGARRLPVTWRLVLRSIGRNRRRTAMTAGGVVLSLLLVLVSWSMLDTVDALLAKQFDRLDTSDAQVWFAGPGSRSVLSEVAAIEGIAHVEALLVTDVTVDGPDGSYATRLTALPVDTRLRSFDVVAGDDAGLAGEGVLLGDAMRELTGLEVGDMASLRFPALATLGPVELPVAAFVSQPLGTFAYVDRAEFTAAAGTDALPVTGAQLAYEQGADPDAIEEAVSDVGGVVAVEPTDAIRRLVADAIGLFYAFVGAMLAAGAVLAAAVIFTTQSVSIAERAREVATLRASGVPLRRIAAMITAENLLVTLLAVVPGLFLGVAGGRAMFQTYSNDQFRLDFVVAPRTLVLSAAVLLLVAVASQLPGLRTLRRLDLAQTVRERAT